MFRSVQEKKDEDLVLSAGEEHTLHTPKGFKIACVKKLSELTNHTIQSDYKPAARDFPGETSNPSNGAKIVCNHASIYNFSNVRID